VIYCLPTVRSGHTVTRNNARPIPYDRHMSSTVASPLPSDYLTSPAAGSRVSLFRLYTLRVAYLVLALGLGAMVWPSVINHTNDTAARHGPQLALLAGIGATAILGLRYPVKMLPLLLFEVIWKAIYLIAFALPLWAAHQITPAVAEDIQAVLWVVIFIPLIPWRYVFAQYVLERSERWK